MHDEATQSEQAVPRHADWSIGHVKRWCPAGVATDIAGRGLVLSLRQNVKVIEPLGREDHWGYESDHDRHRNAASNLERLTCMQDATRSGPAGLIRIQIHPPRNSFCDNVLASQCNSV